MADAVQGNSKTASYSGIWRISEWLSILLYVVLVAQFLKLWINPGPEDGGRIATLSMMVIFEFVLAHSGVFMAAFPKKIALFVFVPFYGVFALAMNATVPGNAILVLYLGVVLMRMRFIFSNPSDDAKVKAAAMSFIAVFLCMFCMIGFSAAADSLPKIGLTSAYLEKINFRQIAGSTGDFTDSPHAAMAMGVTYFTLLALFEILIYGLLRKHEENSKSA